MPRTGRPKSDTPTEAISIRLPVELVAWLRSQAHREEIRMGELVQRALGREQRRLLREAVIRCGGGEE
jgi:hypothetical protein